ncbi:MAG: family transcriptional regulator [Paenibacillus sp.]|nr:family transcriptional regulator [Paenibacillus sp.]
MADVLEQVWLHRNISRVELVERTGLTSGTITNLTHELIKQEVIREYESVSGSVGRKRVMLGFDLRKYRLLGLDIGRASVCIVVVDLDGTIVSSIAQDMSGPRGQGGPEAYMQVIEPLLLGVKRELEASGHAVLGLGVGVPGPMDWEAGVLLEPPNFPGWSGFPIKQRMEQLSGLPTIIDDDARTSALAERWYGLGRSAQNLVFITMGIGIGGGVISEGRIVRGENGLCGQVGHMTIEVDGRLCACGNYGCWETVGSIPGILRRWSGGETMDELIAAIARGEPEAKRCMEQTLRYLETALVNVCNLYDPEWVVLGGKLYEYLADYMEPVQERLSSRLYAFTKDRMRVKPSTFGATQSAVGAASMLFARLVAEPMAMLAAKEQTT